MSYVTGYSVGADTSTPFGILSGINKIFAQASGDTIIKLTQGEAEAMAAQGGVASPKFFRITVEEIAPLPLGLPRSRQLERDDHGENY